MVAHTSNPSIWEIHVDLCEFKVTPEYTRLTKSKRESQAVVAHTPLIPALEKMRQEVMWLDGERHIRREETGAQFFWLRTQGHSVRGFVETGSSPFGWGAGELSGQGLFPLIFQRLLWYPALGLVQYIIVRGHWELRVIWESNREILVRAALSGVTLLGPKDGSAGKGTSCASLLTWLWSLETSRR